MTPHLQDPLPGARRVAVLGLGRSGIAAAHLLARFGKEVVASDSRADLDAAALGAQLPPGTVLHLGGNTLAGADAVVLSPGIPPNAPIVAQAMDSGVELLAELELGFRASRLPMVAITGTDGKTTTTLLTAHLLRQGGLPVTVAGNIGTPLAEVVADASEGWLVVEVSAFQMLHCPRFAPRILVATNIAEDHMDYFAGDWEAYVAAKRRPLGVMGASDLAVLNASNPAVASWSAGTQAQLAWYGKADDVPESDGLRGLTDGATLRFCRGTHALLSLPRSGLPLAGDHNVANALAATLAAFGAGVGAQAIVEGLGSFTPPPHRIETVRERDGVVFVNDSKATNPHAALAGLRTVQAPVVLIAGGVDKGLSLSGWLDGMQGRVVALVLIGELAGRLETEASAARLDAERVHAASMDEAVGRGAELAVRLGARTLLLSPGCSSFDMFTSYAARGEAFRGAVARL